MGSFYKCWKGIAAYLFNVFSFGSTFDNLQQRISFPGERARIQFYRTIDFACLFLGVESYYRSANYCCTYRMGFSLFKATHYKRIGWRNLGKYYSIYIFNNNNYSALMRNNISIGKLSYCDKRRCFK